MLLRYSAASYIGQCSKCDQPIEGQPPSYAVRFWVDDDKRICAKCGPEMPDIQPEPIQQKKRRKR